MLRFRRILCPIDFSDTSREAMRVAVDAAQRFDAELVLFHAYPVPGYLLPDGFVPMTPDQIQNLTTSIRESLEAWKKEAVGQSGGRVPIATASQMGIPFVEILRFAEEGKFDLVVMGTHGRTGLPHLLIGSVAERVVRKAPCAVLTIRSAAPRSAASQPSKGASQ